MLKQEKRSRLLGATRLCAPEKSQRERGSRVHGLSQGLAASLGCFSPLRDMRVGFSCIENQLVLLKLLKDFLGSSTVDRTMVYPGEFADSIRVYRGHGQTWLAESSDTATLWHPILR